VRLSDAMLLGSTMIELRPSNWHSCAIGAAGRAVGILPDLEHPGRVVENILDYWPWLEANHENRLCEIVTLFDQRVCRREMSLDQLIEFVRSIEPPCSCGSYNCCCTRVEQVMDEMRAEYAAAVEVEF
jgi:hypothetical protein